MTKKDYEIIAIAFNDDMTFLNRHYPHYDSDRTDKRKSYDTALNHIIQTARRMARNLANDNESFDKVKFLRACGLSDNQLMSYDEIPRTQEHNSWSKV